MPGGTFLECEVCGRKGDCIPCINSHYCRGGRCPVCFVEILGEDEQYDKIWELQFTCESCCFYGSHNIIVELGKQGANVPPSSSILTNPAVLSILQHVACQLYSTLLLKLATGELLVPTLLLFQQQRRAHQSSCNAVPAGEPAPARNVPAAGKAKQGSTAAAAEKRPRSAGEHVQLAHAPLRSAHSGCCFTRPWSRRLQRIPLVSNLSAESAAGR